MHFVTTLFILAVIFSSPNIQAKESFFVYIHGGNYYIANSPTAKRNVSLEISALDSIEKITLKDKIDSKAFSYSFLVGYKKNRLRYGAEISRMNFDINTTVKNTNIDLSSGNIDITQLVNTIRTISTSLNLNLNIDTSGKINPSITSIKNEMQLNMILAKCFYDFPIKNTINLYLGSGLGITHIKYKSISKVEINILRSILGNQASFLEQFTSRFPELNLSEQQSTLTINQSLLTGQLICGTAWKFDKNIDIFLEYHLTKTAKIKSPIS
ncbi:MAG: hypothetical protein HRT87_11160, partial [Legionellales bacterium]|nr:hypothetical protein [Legionellales bacterium]